MKKNTIAKSLNKIEKIENTIEKIGKFIKTERGRQFVNYLHRAPYKELCTRFNVPKFMMLFNNSTSNINLINAAIEKYGTILEDPPKVIRMRIKTLPKYKIRLTRKELKEINAKRPRKMGFAALMYAYEEYKMSKYVKDNPAPTEKELAEDLFPDELEAGYKTKLYIHREYVRNLLCKIHANIIPNERYYRVFRVYSKPLSSGKKVISEVEHDMPMIADFKTSRKTLREKLLMLAKSAKSADKDVIKVKLYDKYGNLHMTHTFIEH